MPTSLKETATQARQDRKCRFTNLSKLLDRELLIDSYRLLNKRTAKGVDGISARAYGEDLEANVTGLISRMSDPSWVGG